MGKAKNLRKRVTSYFLKNISLGIKTRILVSQIAKIKTIRTNSETEAFLLENFYIKRYKPKYNLKLTDDKAYPMVQITIKDKYPKLLIARRRDDNPSLAGSIYFGPYPNAGYALRHVLKTIRKIFPYQSAVNHAKKICLYNHLGLCPCPPMFDNKEFQKEYRKTIRYIVDFLNGKTKKIMKDLKKDRDIFSKSEEFEKANIIQKKIDAIKLITSPVYNQFDYEINPNLTQDLLCNPLSSLRNILSKNKIKTEKLERIECFDISNISGTNAVGSMVTFTNGEKDTSGYRRFKIRTLKTPNDFGMLEEVLKRRLSHKDWDYPDLIIVDGGKGQVSIASKVLKENKLKIPLIGLAKKEEIIVTSNLKEICLPKNSDALKLIMRIRDEAHRFAISYHRKLRSKSLFF